MSKVLREFGLVHEDMITFDVNAWGVWPHLTLNVMSLGSSSLARGIEVVYAGHRGGEVLVGSQGKYIKCSKEWLKDGKIN